MKLGIITTNAEGFIHAGIDIERAVKVFELPEEIAEYIAQHSGQYKSVSLVVVEE